MRPQDYIFPAAQAEFLRAFRDGRLERREFPASLPPSASVAGSMPPVHGQALRGTCVAAAVVSLLEYLGDCKTRLSVQFLDAATKKVERDGLEECLAAVRAGRRAPEIFEKLFEKPLGQLRMLSGMNGGMDTPAMRTYMESFEHSLRSSLDTAGGSLLRSCFRAAAEYGVCRHMLWPYAAAAASGAVPSGPEFPPGTLDDAGKRRLRDGAYILPAPNNAEEIAGLLAGANGRRPVPVCVTVDYFEGCHDGAFSFPRTEEAPDGTLRPADARQGVHCVAVDGYRIDAAAPGGGVFSVRNSWGSGWGRDGCGEMPFAYLECFAREAGTVLQDMVDYAGDGYGGAPFARPAMRLLRSRAARVAAQLAAAALTVGAAVALTRSCSGRGGEAGRGTPPPPRRDAAQNPPAAIPDDGGAPQECAVRILGTGRGEVAALVLKLLPDARPKVESDEWNDTLTMRISRSRFKRLAVELQARQRQTAYMTDQGRTLQVTGPGAARAVSIETDVPFALIRWIRLTQPSRAKILRESEFRLELLVFDRDDFVSDMEKSFSVRRDGRVFIVKSRPGDRPGGKGEGGGE